MDLVDFLVSLLPDVWIDFLAARRKRKKRDTQGEQ